MPTSLAFILGLLDRSTPAYIAAEDLDGPHGPALRLWQRMGFLDHEGEPHPVPSCPHCRRGVLVVLDGRPFCAVCGGAADPRHVLRWRFDLERFLAWLAERLRLSGDVRPAGEALWQLGTLADPEFRTECFFARGAVSEQGCGRLFAYRNAVLLKALPESAGVATFRGPCFSLQEVLQQDGRALRVTPVRPLLRKDGAVRFDLKSGALFAGDLYLGEVPVGSKEYHFLAALAEHLDRFVAYADLKHEVLRRSGSRDTIEEATFCQRLKSRIKQRQWIPRIDELVATTNKGDGYRLRGHVGV